VKQKILYAGCVFFLIVIMGLYFRWQMHREIKELLNNSIHGVETGNVGLATAFISKNYHDKLGYVRNDIIDIAKDAFKELKEIHITITNQTITKTQEVCLVSIDFKAVATVGPERGYIAGTPQRAEKVNLHLNKEENGWRIVSIEGLKYL
jgi:hypothetical protein